MLDPASPSLGFWHSVSAASWGSWLLGGSSGTTTCAERRVKTTKQWVRTYHDVSSPRWSAFRIRGYRRRPAAAADFDSRVSAPPALWIASVEVSEAEKILITSFIYVSFIIHGLIVSP